MKVVQLISWEGDLPVWILDSGLLSRAERIDVVNFIASLVPDDETDLTILSFPLEIGEGRESRTVCLEGYFRGLDISKNDPSKGYLLSQLQGGCGGRANDLARRLVLLRGSVFFANRAPLNKDEEEILFLLAEHRLNERAIELQRLRRRVERQRRILVPGTGTTQGQRRALSDELVRVILERDQVCQECGSDEDLQLDHVIPVSRGGNDSEDNLRVLCGTCNRRRGALNL